MFTFVVCLICTIFATTLSEYLPIEDYKLQNPYEVEYAHEYKNYEPKDYHFQYAVSDPHTGDHKSQWEVKEKGVVRGMYSLLEPDGTTRVVEYIADDDGFRATVKKLGTPIGQHEHHGEEALHSLPEAYNNGYHGAYSGLGENYGATPIEANSGVIEANKHQEIEYPVENYEAPVEPNNYESNYHVSPIQTSNHHDTSAEVHGFTGNSEDDSSYTNFNDDGGNNGAIYYLNDAGESNQHNYYAFANPQIISSPYQYNKPYAYLSQSYHGY